MPPPEDRARDDRALEPRVSALEREMVEIRRRVVLAGTDAGAARVLAAGADRDVSEVRAELRAHTGALNALRETQLELCETQMQQGEQIAALDVRMREGFATVGGGMAEITALLGRIAREE